MELKKIDAEVKVPDPILQNPSKLDAARIGLDKYKNGTIIAKENNNDDCSIF